MSWFELNSRGQAWYSHGMSYAEMIWGHFYSLDKNGWVTLLCFKLTRLFEQYNVNICFLFLPVCLCRGLDSK